MQLKLQQKGKFLLDIRRNYLFVKFFDSAEVCFTQLTT